MYAGYTEPEDVIIARMKRILADYQPPAEPVTPLETATAAEMAQLNILDRLQVLCFALSFWIRTQIPHYLTIK